MNYPAIRNPAAQRRAQMPHRSPAARQRCLNLSKQGRSVCPFHTASISALQGKSHSDCGAVTLNFVRLLNAANAPTRGNNKGRPTGSRTVPYVRMPPTTLGQQESIQLNMTPPLVVPSSKGPVMQRCRNPHLAGHCSEMDRPKDCFQQFLPIDGEKFASIVVNAEQCRVRLIYRSRDNGDA